MPILAAPLQAARRSRHVEPAPSTLGALEAVCGETLRFLTHPTHPVLGVCDMYVCDSTRWGHIRTHRVLRLEDFKTNIQ